MGQIYISQLYIKLDKKLIVDIEEIKLTTDSTVKSSYEDLVVNIKKIPTILKFFETIHIESLLIDGNRFKIIFDDNHIYLDNKFLNLSSKYTKAANQINLQLYSLYLKDINLLFEGKIKLDYFSNVASFYGDFALGENLKGELNTQLSKESIDFFVKTQETNNIRFLKEFFRLDEVAESWMYDNVIGKMKLNYLTGKLDPTTFEPLPNSIKGEAIIKNAQIHFNKKVAPVKTSKLLISYEKDTLSFDMHKPTYKHLSIDGSSVTIPHLSSEEKGRVDVLIKTQEVLGKEILDILRAYDIPLPIEQLSGQTKAEVLLKIPYIKPLESFGNFELKNSKFIINNSFPFYSKYANVELKNSKVMVKSSHFKHKKLVDATLDLTIDTNTLKANGDALINEFMIQHQDEEIVNLNQLQTPISMDFNDISSINIHKIKSKIVLNKENTEVNIDNLQILSKYSDMLRKNSLTEGNLNLYIIDEKEISFDGRITDLDLPIKRDNEAIDFLDFVGSLKNEDITIQSKENDILFEIKKNDAIKITLEKMHIYPQKKSKNSVIKRMNMKLIDSVVYLNEEIFYPKNMDVSFLNDDVYFNGEVTKLELPFLDNGELLTELTLKGNVKNNEINIVSKDERINFKIINEKDIQLKLNNIDLLYDVNENVSENRNIQVSGNNSNIYIKMQERRKILATRYEFALDENRTYFELSHDTTTMKYEKDNKGMISINAVDVTDDFINTLFDKDFVEGGSLAFEGTGRDNVITGRISFKNNKIKNLRTLNNIISLVNTSPGLVNPLLAIPSVFSMVTSGGFNLNGYSVKNGYVDLIYNTETKLLHMYKIHTVGNSVDFDGFSTFDFTKDTINSDMNLVFMKSYSNAIDYIPGLDYILLGDDKVISTQVNIRGKIEDPEITTNILKDTATAPLDVIKRIFTLPLKPFLD